MKKLFTLIILGAIIYFGYAHFDEIKTKISSEFLGLFSGFQKDYEKKTSLARSGYGEISVQTEIDRLKKSKNRELSTIDNQIRQKDAKLKQVMADSTLTLSQKKSQTTLLQKDINTLKAQKESIEAKYRKLIKETRE